MTTTIFMPNFFDRFYFAELQKEIFQLKNCTYTFVDGTKRSIEIYIVHENVFFETVDSSNIENLIKGNEFDVMNDIFKLYEVYQNEIFETISLI